MGTHVCTCSQLKSHSFISTHLLVLPLSRISNDALSVKNIFRSRAGHAASSPPPPPNYMYNGRWWMDQTLNIAIHSHKSEIVSTQMYANVSLYTNNNGWGWTAHWINLRQRLFHLHDLSNRAYCISCVFVQHTHTYNKHFLDFESSETDKSRCIFRDMQQIGSLMEIINLLLTRRHRVQFMMVIITCFEIKCDRWRVAKITKYENKLCRFINVCREVRFSPRILSGFLESCN